MPRVDGLLPRFHVKTESASKDVYYIDIASRYFNIVSIVLKRIRRSPAEYINYSPSIYT